MPAGPGRPRRYCRPSHRQRAYEARREATRRGLGPDEVLLSRRSWETLRDALYRLETATEDVAGDLVAGRPTKADYVDALAWLARFGNPYEINIADITGRTAIDFGVYAAPESFLVDPDGNIVFKQIGAVTPEIVEQEIAPRVRQWSKAP